MRLLHTSDWHLGRSLYNRKRYDEFAAFLEWLIETINQHQVDALLIAGDIFDTGTPSNRAQELYYNFLRNIGQTCCRHVIIVAGNHDSPSFLNAPRDLLRTLDIHVIGSIPDNPSDELLLLNTPDKTPELLVCAIPYLRDRDIRTAEAGESISDKQSKLLEGIRNHYATLGELAEQQRNHIDLDIPIVATGHLFTAGGKTLQDDGVRDLYIGSLAHVHSNTFPTCIDYLALGHLHIPQRVNGAEHMRYSGSPLPMGFGEARQQKSICLVEFSGRTPNVQLLPVPVFQHLEQIRGDLNAIQNRLSELANLTRPIWLEILYDSTEVIGNLREQLETMTTDTRLEILSIRNLKSATTTLQPVIPSELLEELDVTDVFQRCMNAHNVPETQQPDLMDAYQEILHTLREAETK